MLCQQIQISNKNEKLLKKPGGNISCKNIIKRVMGTADEIN